MSSARTYLRYCIIPFCVLLAVLILNPNPFGNSPDAVADESYFLTSSLSALQKHTLPGWDFSRTGSFYGGIQVYLDLIMIIPALVGMILINKSVFLTQLWVSTHTGTLLHATRLLSGIVFLLVTLGWAAVYKKKSLPKESGFSLLLLLALLLGNSLFLGMIHTAKVWALYSIMEVLLGIIVIIQEQTRRSSQPLFRSNTRYIATLCWLILGITMQNVTGIINIAWIAYALFLGHITLQDIGVTVKKMIIPVTLFFLTQLSFLYRGFLMFFEPDSPLKLTDLTGTSIRTTSGMIDWSERLLGPLSIALQTQPLLIVYGVALIIFVFLWKGKKEWLLQHKLYTIAVVHPLIIIVFRHGLFGMGVFPRYVLPLTIAFTLSIVAMAQWKRLEWKVFSLVAVFLGLILSSFISRLYWQPSSEKLLNDVIVKTMNSPSTAFIIDGSAGRLNLPMNKASLDILTETKKRMGRYAFQVQHSDQITDTAFHSTVAIVDQTTSVADYTKKLSQSHAHVWVISSDCTKKCSLEEQRSGACIVVNDEACHITFATPHEVSVWRDYFLARQLGAYYTLQKISPSQLP